MCLRTDLATNAQHCGDCGHACSPGQVCRDGVCACPRATEWYCGGVCVDVRSSLSNCGACGVSCPTSASACVDGACQCPGVRGVLCYGYCQDLDNDVRNCGACGNACASGQQCVSGRCLPAPRSPALGARYATARPTFRWTPSGVTMARVQVCADSRCARVVASFESATTSVTASQDLPAGLLFWRVGDPSIEVYSATRAFAVSRLRGATGSVIGTLHDLTGDGLADLLVGAPGGSLVTLWRGRSGLGPGDPIDVRPPSVMGFGARLAFGGDFDSDGVAEAMVGAYGAPSSYTDHRLRGDGTVARLWDSGLSYANVWAGVGDVNGDGFADFAYGDTGANHVAVRPGSLEGRSTPEMVTYGEVGSEHGAAVSAAWDVDGDGFEDVLVGAPSADASLGRATLYYGATSSLTRTAALTRPPDVTGFGAWLTGLGDIDGDGLGDLLVGARTPSWRAFVYRSATLSDLPTPIEGPVGTVARFVAAGDVNGDGYADALLPLPATGRALLYRGGAGGFVEAPEAIVDAAWSRATGAVIGTGDLDGDGFDDIAAGDPSLGVVRVFFGHATRPLARQVTLTGVAAERFGASLG